MSPATPTTPMTGVSDSTSMVSGNAFSGRAEATEPEQAATSQALESALQVTDLQSAQAQASQSSVNLRFNVAGENLSVRVALQEGQVHTQFRTDSGELRTALAHEWQSVGAGPNGQVRFADPVFTSGAAGNSKTAADLGGNSGNQFSRQQAGSNADPEIQVASVPAQRSAQPSPATVGQDPAPVEPSLSTRLRMFA